MKLTGRLVVFDAPDVAAESGFWARMLDGTIAGNEAWQTVSVDGQPQIGVQLAPNLVPPEWPDGTPQQMHLDLWVEDIRAAHDEALAKGARFLQAAPDLDAPNGWQVYLDPAGHPFCLCWG
jgi:hypothetical protein